MSSTRREVTICEEKNVYNDIFSYPSEFIHSLRKHNKLTLEGKERVNKAWDAIYDEEKEDFINKKAEEFKISYLESKVRIDIENETLKREQDMVRVMKQRMSVRKYFHSEEIQQKINIWNKIYCDKPIFDDDGDIIFVDSLNQ